MNCLWYLLNFIIKIAIMFPFRRTFAYSPTINPKARSSRGGGWWSRVLKVQDEMSWGEARRPIHPIRFIYNIFLWEGLNISRLFRNLHILQPIPTLHPPFILNQSLIVFSLDEMNCCKLNELLLVALVVVVLLPFVQNCSVANPERHHLPLLFWLSNKSINKPWTRKTI